jgi:hypothetical protein
MWATEPRNDSGVTVTLVNGTRRKTSLTKRSA